MHNVVFSSNIDLTEVILSTFVLFFVGLILYLSGVLHVSDKFWDPSPLQGHQC